MMAVRTKCLLKPQLPEDTAHRAVLSVALRCCQTERVNQVAFPKVTKRVARAGFLMVVSVSDERKAPSSPGAMPSA
jgi:hypothetical protein